MSDLTTPTPPRRKAIGFWPTMVLLVGAAYCLLPIFWVVVASTKLPGELFTTFSFRPSFNWGLTHNLSQLSNYRNGQYWVWTMNSMIYSAGGSLMSVIISAMAGFGLAKYEFAGRRVVFTLLMSAVLIPGVVLAMPQYLLISKIGMAGGYWSVLLPSLLSPLGIYLCRIYAEVVIPDEMLEAGRVDGAGEMRLFFSIGLVPMLPGMITVFMLHFVGTWNNFLLPFIMLSDERKFPLTVGLYTLVNQGIDQPGLYSMIITGAMVAMIPLILLFLMLQRFWKLDLISGSVKG